MNNINSWIQGLLYQGNVDHGLLATYGGKKSTWGAKAFGVDNGGKQKQVVA